MKVLLSIDAVGGVFTFGAELARGLTARGVEVVIAVLGPAMRADQRLPLEGLRLSALAERDGRLEWMEDPWEDLEISREWLVELARRERVDLVHLSSYSHASAPFGVPVCVGAHSCVMSWWRAVHGGDAPAAWDRYRRAVREGLARAAAVIAPTRAMLDELVRHHGPLSGPALVIPNGSSAPAAPPATPKEPFVLAAGRMWDPAKNLAVLERAAAGLRAPVLVAGEPSPTGGTGTVTALGPLSAGDLAALRRRAAVFAAPARYEPFGLAALEAARDRCALVLGDIPSLREVWGSDAVFVAPGDHGRLHRTLASLTEDREEARRLGARAQRRAARYGSEAMARRHLALYRRLCRTEVAACAS